MAANTRVVACRVFTPELLALGVPDEKIIFLDQGLHRTPEELHRRLGLELAALEGDEAVDTVILAYGLCGGGLEGCSSGRLRLVIPLAHDCIPLLLGRDPGPEAGQVIRTFFLSAGWIDYGQTPLTEYYQTAERLGEDNARWTTREIMKHYRDVALIDGPLVQEPRYWAYAQEMAELTGLACGRVPGSLAWLQRLLAARESRGVRIVLPGTKIERHIYPAGGATTTF
ncbi:MAG: DUF1638 domain-containing protein [Proteobacteria bacterium]|nr:DUF1638 domain-containing protein [Pseudomonadota bacterium]MBU1742553.1 DUF1638 domain-containing protein [Pseudomonadota bacterium]